MANLAYELRKAIRADLIAEGIVTATQCVVERQGDVLQEVAGIVAKTGSVAVTIAPADSEMLDPESKSLMHRSTIRIHLWARPVLAAVGSAPEEDLAEAIVRRLHHLVIDGIHNVAPGYEKGQRLHVVSWADVDDPEYLRTTITVRTLLCLT